MVDAAGGSPEEPTRRGLRSPRAVGLVLVALALTGITVSAATQVILAVFAPPRPPTSLGCRAGVIALERAVARARLEAARRASGELEALAAFRAALLPEWPLAPSIEAACRGAVDGPALEALRAVTLLRYAEERAVRYEALDLSVYRTRAPRLTAALAPPAQSPPQ
jgi:hypothetical protein